MKKLILVGGGGHCKSCIDVIEQTGEYEIAGVLDIPEKIGQKVLGYEITGSDEDIEKYAKRDVYFLITLGQIESADLRKKLFETIKKSGGKFATVISPRAYVSKYSKIGEGTIVMHDALVNAGAEIGKNCILNTKCLVEHDCVVEDNVHIAVGAVLSGGVKVSAESFIGTNSTVVQYKEIAPKSFVKAGMLYK